MFALSIEEWDLRLDFELSFHSGDIEAVGDLTAYSSSFTVVFYGGFLGTKLSILTV